MKVSILTITRDDSEGLLRTLESVRRQKLCDGLEVEHVVVDSSGSAEAEKNRKACGSGVVYVWTPPEGIYPAMNRALALSSGDVIGILNGGDVYADSEALRRVVGAMADESVDYTLSDVVFRGSKRYYSGARFSVRSMEQGVAPPHPSFYARRKVYDLLGPYDEKFRIVADFDFFARLVNRTDLKGAYIPGPLVEMEPGGTSQTFMNRVGSNTVEKFRSLRANGLKASWLRLYSRFFVIIYTQFLIRNQK